MTDPELADRTYIEPLTPEWVRKVIDASGPTHCCPRGWPDGVDVAMAL